MLLGDDSVCRPVPKLWMAVARTKYWDPGTSDAMLTEEGMLPSAAAATSMQSTAVPAG